jgi:PAS domain S-box-containing protein
MDRPRPARLVVWDTLTMRAPLREFVLVAAGALAWILVSRLLPVLRDMPGVVAGVAVLVAAYTVRPGPTAVAALIAVGATAVLRSDPSPWAVAARAAFAVALGAGAVGLAAIRHARDEAMREYAVLFEHNPMPMWVFDAETTAFLRVNLAAIRTYGYTREEFARMTLRDIRPPEDLAEFDDVVRRGFPQTRTAWRHLTKDGRCLEVFVRAQAITFHGRQARIALLEDVSERRDLEVQLRQAQKMEAVGQLAAGVAHDFNNLLAVITGFTTLTLDGLPKNDARREDLEQVVRASDRAADLIQQLLAFSRKQLMQMRVLSLTDAVNDMLPMLRRLVGETIELDARASGKGMARADAGQLQQVLMNLVVNARDAITGHGHITIEVRDVLLDSDYCALHPGAVAGPHVLLTVSDTGAGMDKATQARVFEPFFTTKPSGQGTGLGLSTVYGIVQQFGGHITVYSEPGKGTTFKVYLPRTDEAIEATASKIRRVRAGRTRTVLLVDDELAVQGVAARILRRAGYVVHTAGRPGDAIAALESGLAPDVLLTDVVLPDMNGQALADAVLRLRPACKVVFMSGYTEAAVIRLGDLSSGAAFIAKPFTAAGLTEAIGDLFEPREELASS